MVRFLIAGLLLSVALVANEEVAYKIESRLQLPKELGVKALRSIAIHPTRGVIVSDEATHRVFVLEFGKSSWRVLAGSVEHGDRDSTQGQGRFAMPQGLFVASNGDILVADSSNHKIKKIDEANALITIAGSGEKGSSVGYAPSIQLDEPAFALALNDGSVLISDTYNHQIKKLVGSNVELFGGLDMGFKDGMLKEARFAAPTALCVDDLGNIFVSDTLNHAVRVISPSGVVSTLAGKANAGYKDGDGALFSFPLGIACSGGTVFVADSKNNAIRKITSSGKATTIIGGNDNLVTKLKEPTAVVADNEGRLFVLDSGNKRVLILKEK